MDHANIVSMYVDALNIGEAEDIEGFDRRKNSIEHLESIRYDNLFPRTRVQSEESHSVSIKHQKVQVDAKEITENEIINTRGRYKKRGTNP